MDRHPVLFLFLECSSQLYDVSYDPDKTVIQFQDWAPILSLVGGCFSFLVSPFNTNTSYFENIYASAKLEKQKSPGKKAIPPLNNAKQQSPPHSAPSTPPVQDSDDDQDAPSSNISSILTNNSPGKSKLKGSANPPKLQRTRSNSGPPFFTKSELSYHKNPHITFSSSTDQQKKKSVTSPPKTKHTTTTVDDEATDSDHDFDHPNYHDHDHDHHHEHEHEHEHGHRHEHEHERKRKRDGDADAPATSYDSDDFATAPTKPGKKKKKYWNHKRKFAVPTYSDEENGGDDDDDENAWKADFAKGTPSSGKSAKGNTLADIFRIVGI